MPYTKEKLRAYWQTHKDQINQKRRQKRRLTKFGLAIPGQVSHQPKMANPVAHLPQVNHGKPQNGKPSPETANPKLTQLIQEWQTQTNYSCASSCAYAYCNNC